MPAPTVQGSVVALLAGDPALAALVPGGVFGGVEPETSSLPFLVVKDTGDSPEWVTKTARLEKHTLHVTAWAKSGGVAGADNPAEAIARNVVRVLNWDDLAIPGATPLSFRQTKHSLSVEGKRAPDKERVGKAELEWEVLLGFEA
jgi:hypothetical protein